MSSRIVVLSDKGSSSSEEGVGSGGNDDSLGLSHLTGRSTERREGKRRKERREMEGSQPRVSATVSLVFPLAKSRTFDSERAIKTHEKASSPSFLLTGRDSPVRAA